MKTTLLRNAVTLIHQTFNRQKQWIVVRRSAAQLVFGILLSGWFPGLSIAQTCIASDMTGCELRVAQFFISEASKRNDYTGQTMDPYMFAALWLNANSDRKQNTAQTQAYYANVSFPANQSGNYQQIFYDFYYKISTGAYNNYTFPAPPSSPPSPPIQCNNCLPSLLCFNYADMLHKLVADFNYYIPQHHYSDSIVYLLAAHQQANYKNTPGLWLIGQHVVNIYQIDSGKVHGIDAYSGGYFVDNATNNFASIFDLQRDTRDPAYDFTPISWGQTAPNPDGAGGNVGITWHAGWDVGGFATLDAELFYEIAMIKGGTQLWVNTHFVDLNENSIFNTGNTQNQSPETLRQHVIEYGNISLQPGWTLNLD